jgi:hypothetical protein
LSLAEMRKALPREEVSYMGTSFFVRGLSLTHVSALVASRRAEVSAALEQWSDAKGDAGVFASTLLSTLPGLVAQVIAEAADEPDMAEAAAGLPAPVQVEALAAVARLTFESVDRAGEFLATVVRAIQAGKAVAARATSAG